jgi:hypothetical protein
MMRELVPLAHPYKPNYLEGWDGERMKITVPDQPRQKIHLIPMSTEKKLG